MKTIKIFEAYRGVRKQTYWLNWSRPSLDLSMLPFVSFARVCTQRMVKRIFCHKNCNDSERKGKKVHDIDSERSPDDPDSLPAQQV